MSIKGDYYEFSQKNVDNSPTDKGVYALYEDYDTIYIGKGDGIGGIRVRLQSHKRGDEGTCTMDATDYKREICMYPLSRERELLQEYKNIYGKLPKCNDVMP